jgi:ABC-type uncharacterized transport system involved in gliding motility auxiliary subunit
MQLTRSSRRQLQLQNLVFLTGLLVLVGLLAWLSTRYSYEADWTSSGRNTLSVDSSKLLDKMPGPIHITAFARETLGVRRHISGLVARYQRHKPDVELSFVNPDADPDRVRELGITLDGELLVAYQGRSEKVQDLSEQDLTNALLRIAHQKERRVVFLEGHGERDPHGQANHDLGKFGALLEQKGIGLETLTLAETPQIPADTSLLVIADPRTPLLVGEVQIINRYVREGGNFLWLAEPGNAAGLEAVAETLGVEFLPGVVVDATTQLFGIDDPAFALIPDYPMHAITREMNSLTLFPQAAALEVSVPEGWQGEPLLTTLDRAWTEIGERRGTIRFDPDSDERMGPLDIGFALHRPQQKSAPSAGERPTEQRVVVIGDADFISNAFLGNGGNIDLGLSLFNWLNHDDSLVTITARTATDINLELSKTAQIMIGFGFLFGLPLLLLGAGLTIWWRRRRR